MVKFIRSESGRKCVSWLALSFIGLGILLIFASALLAHHGEGLSTGRPGDIVRGTGIAGNLTLMSGVGLGLTNGIKPTVETLLNPILGPGGEPGEEGEKEEDVEEIEPEEEEEEPTEPEEEKPKEPEEEKPSTFDTLVKSFKDQGDVISALNSIIGIEGTRQSWSKFTKHVDDITEQLTKMGKPWAAKWKTDVLKKAGYGKLDLPDSSKLIGHAGTFMKVVDGAKNVLEKIQKRGYTTKTDIACAVVAEAGKQFISTVLTKNPVVGLADTIVGSINPKYNVSGLLNQADDKWHEVTQEYFNNIYNNDKEISDQLQGQWNLSKNKVMSNPNLSLDEKRIRLGKLYKILFS